MPDAPIVASADIASPLLWQQVQAGGIVNVAVRGVPAIAIVGVAA